MDNVLVGVKAFASSFIPVIAGYASVLAGFVIIGSAISNFTKLGDGNYRGTESGVTWGSVGLRLLIGGMLLQLSTSMQGVSEMLFGLPIQDYRGVLAYANARSAGGPGPWAQVMEVALLWVVLLGWVAAFRGFLQWNTAASGGGGSGGSAGDYFWKGLWHIIGGGVAINLSGAISSFLGK